MSENNEKKDIGSSYDEAGKKREQQRRRSQRLRSIVAVVGALLVFTLVIFVGTYLFVWVNDALESSMGDLAISMGGVDPNEVEETPDTVEVMNPVEEVSYTQEELDEQIAAAVAAAEAAAIAGEDDRVLGALKDSLSSGTSVVEALRPLYPDDIVIYSSGAYHFLPIRADLKQHSYTEENLHILENGRYEYIEDGSVVSHFGIDVSRHQGKIDWAKVAADGVEFAIIRVGFRGYGTGAIVEDEYFEDNIKGAISNGIRVGVYFFSQAVNEEEALEEAQFVLDLIAPYRIECPVVFDVEKVADNSARMNALTMEERTQIALAFLEAVEAEGYHTMLYHNMEMSTMLVDVAQLEDYEKWFAYYGDDFYYPYEFGIWQFSESGKVDGIGTNVDMNIAFHWWEE